MAARKKVGELQDYKDKRRRQREINNLEQRMLLDQIADNHKQSKRQHATVPWKVGDRDRLPLAKDKDVRHLQIEYERAREKGKRPNPTVFAPQHRYRKPYLPENETPRYNPHADPKVQQLAEIHGRQMEYLQNKNRDLERQRDEIRRRLEELSRRPPVKDNSTDELLRELREQEARNQRLLNELRLQLAEARRPINVVQQHAAAEPGKKNFIYPVFYGNSLVAEIIAVRQAYLQNGGNDPDILAQLAQMLAEAQAIDDSMKHVQIKKPRDKKDGSATLLALEMENERLQRQLMLLQEQKIISGNRRKDNREGRSPDSASRPGSPHKSRRHQSPPHVLPTSDQSLPQEPNSRHQPPPSDPHTRQEAPFNDPKIKHQHPPDEPNTKHQHPPDKPDTKHQHPHDDPNTRQPHPPDEPTIKHQHPPDEPNTRHQHPPDDQTTTHQHPTHKQPDTQQQQQPSLYKPAPSYRTMSKWVQTNPVPTYEADTSAFVRLDYPTKRQNARHALEDRWGPENVLPTPAGGPQPLRRSSQVDLQRTVREGFPEPPLALESLWPERLDTIEEAANVDDRNPDEPLDVDLSSITRPRKKYVFPYRADVVPRRNSARLVIVRSEKPHGWVDYYGRPMDENGVLLERQKSERQSVFPYFRKSLTDPRLLAYRRHLNSVYGKPSNPYDPAYSSLYSKRGMYMAEPLDIDTKPFGVPHESTYPLIHQDKKHSQGEVPRTANAGAQTQPLKVRRTEERLQAKQALRKQPMVSSGRDPNLHLDLEGIAEPSARTGRNRQPPPTQRPPILDHPNTQPESQAAASPQPPKDKKGKTKKKGSTK